MGGGDKSNNPDDDDSTQLKEEGQTKDANYGGDLLSVKAIPSSDYVLNGVKNSLNVLLQIKTGVRQTTQTRPPCDLAIVLDRSGSMKGEKLDNCKTAVKMVIDNLTSNDKLHFVIYDDRCDVVFENGDLSFKESLTKKVEGVLARNSTNLQAGLAEGFELLTKHKERGRTQRIFLFSDGLVNKGMQEHSDIFDYVRQVNSKGVSVSSFGIGADFDEELMRGIAEHGSGNYFYIESADMIERFVSKGLKGLLGLVGTEVLLKLRGQNGAIVERIYAHSDIIGGCQLGDLKQDNLRQIVATLSVSPLQGSGATIMKWELSFLPDGETEKVTIKGSVGVKYTEDEHLCLKQNPLVEVAVLIQEIGDNDTEVIKLLDHGKLAEATKVKEGELIRLKAVEASDPSGMITRLIEKTEKSLKDFNDKNKDIASVKKEIHYQGYLKRRNSATALFD